MWRLKKKMSNIPRLYKQIFVVLVFSILFFNLFLTIKVIYVYKYHDVGKVHGTINYIESEEIPKQFKSFLKRLKYYRNSCVPNFLVIGAQKGGTSSFHSYIKKGIHPHLHVPMEGKELNLFTEKLLLMSEYEQSVSEIPFNRFGNKLKNVKNTLDLLLWYQNNFKGSSGGYGRCNKSFSDLWGEVSPNYGPHPFAPLMAKSLLPDAKLIFLLRDPIERTVSAFNMKWQVERCKNKAWTSPNCFLNLNDTINNESDWYMKFNRVIDKEYLDLKKCEIKSLSINNCLGLHLKSTFALYEYLEDNFFLGRSIYVQQIENWFRSYNASNFLFLSSTEFKVNPMDSFRKVCRFLNVDEALLRSIKFETQHVREYPFARLSQEVNNTLAQFFFSYNEKLFNLLENNGHDYIVESLRKSWYSIPDESEKI
jgi:hypothetical protein